MHHHPIGRRDFFKTTAAIVAALVGRGVVVADVRKPKLKKAVKYGMIQVKGSHQEKLELAKKCGFLGVEIDSPGTADLDQLAKASKEIGVVIHGVIDSVHWDKRLSDPDPAVREIGLKALKTAIDDCKFYGATTVLLVPGKVSNETTENYQQCWDRSSAEVRKAIPWAKEAGVKIAIETVWNDFITKPEQLIKYVDQFESPTVGAYFDISNMIKYGVPPAEWVRKLGRRMVKFDFKGYSSELAKKSGKDGDGFKAKIGEGSEDWPEVLKALKEVNYQGGWATAEVGGGGADVLKDISQRMDRILGLA